MILGVKQPDVSRLLPGKTYLFFAHVIKGQQENRALLDKILELGIRLFDYECIREAGAKGSPRLVAFGKFAGYAGMINTFQALGQKLLAHGYSTPFLNISSAYMYRDLDAAEQAVAAVGRDIAAGALDRLGFPLVFTFTGNGNVSRGAQVRRRSLALALSSLLAAPLRVPFRRAGDLPAAPALHGAAARPPRGPRADRAAPGRIRLRRARRLHGPPPRGGRRRRLRRGALPRRAAPLRRRLP